MASVGLAIVLFVSMLMGAESARYTVMNLHFMSGTSMHEICTSNANSVDTTTASYGHAQQHSLFLCRRSPPPSAPQSGQLQGLNLWSTGPILDAVQSNHFFQDSKHFV